MPLNGELEDRMARDGLITIREAAEILGRDVRTVARWAKNGTLAAHRVVGRVYVLRVEVEELLGGLGMPE